jgi:predicted metal-dependent HD superfamily phosphohydrolase
MNEAALMEETRAFCTPFYAGPGRYYHTLNHIEAVLDALEQRHVLTLPLALAVWGHDLIYDPRAHDNEEQSAAVFGDWLAAQGVPDQVQREVAALILATKHDHPPTSRSACLLVDADLSVFGADDEPFWQYEHDIRREYAFVPWAEYQAGRRAVLATFLARVRLYSTPEFSGLEGAARQHLQEARAALEQ